MSKCIGRYTIRLNFMGTCMKVNISYMDGMGNVDHCGSCFGVMWISLDGFGIDFLPPVLGWLNHPSEKYAQVKLDLK